MTTESELCIRTIEEVLMLPRVTAETMQYLPDRPGVYFVMIDAKYLVYVGISRISIKKRWIGHHRQAELMGYGKVLVAYQIETSLEVIDATERYWIDTYDPVCNARSSSDISMAIVDGEKVFTAPPRAPKPTYVEPVETSTFVPTRTGEYSDVVLVDEAAADIGQSKWAILKAIQKGQLATYRIGPMHAIPLEEWERYKREKKPHGKRKES